MMKNSISGLDTVNRNPVAGVFPECGSGRDGGAQDSGGVVAEQIHSECCEDYAAYCLKHELVRFDQVGDKRQPWRPVSRQ